MAHVLSRMAPRLAPLILSICSALLVELPAQAPLTSDQLQQFVLPSGDELAWRAIPWHASFSAGVIAADQVDKPLLLWAMNGHPLGCT